MTVTILSLLAVVLMMAHLLAIGLFLMRLGRPRVPSCGVIGQPFVTLLRPVCGLDPFDEETLRSSFLQDYPAYEIIFCAQSFDDPVIPLLHRLMAEHPQVSARLLVGLDLVSGNPKLNNVWKGWKAAASDWICMTDSNLLLPHDYLSTVVAAWEPRTGLVSAPPVGIRPQGIGGYLECAFLNGNQAVLQGAMDSLGMGFAQGKTLFFNRPLLERAGGLSTLGRTLAEDAAATRTIRGLGRIVTLTPQPFAQPIGKRTLQQVWARQLRWSRVRRDAFPRLFVAEILNGGLMPIASAAVAVTLAGLPPAIALAYAAVWYLAEILLIWRAGWPLGRHALVLPVLRDLMMPAIWIATYARRGFEWRGTTLGPQTLGPPTHEAAGLPEPLIQ
jgi:ceramide glucosyltransferase